MMPNSKKSNKIVKPASKVEIFFSNLDEETQNALLELYGISNPKEMNWEVFPIATIEKPELKENL